jgi:hydroxymethylglutaryl-CoA synthase
VCGQCGAVDQMDDEPMAEVKARVATHAVDWLAASLNPPSVAVIIDFDGGGRCQCELTDGDPATVAVGDREEMTFRRLYTTDGVHNYYWKARPAREAK